MIETVTRKEALERGFLSNNLEDVKELAGQTFRAKELQVR